MRRALVALALIGIAGGAVAFYEWFSRPFWAGDHQ